MRAAVPPLVCVVLQLLLGFLVWCALTPCGIGQVPLTPATGSQAQEPRPGEPPAAAAGADKQDEDKDKKPKEPRRGIPVTDPLVHTHCARCHALDERQHMTRISYLRKSPEGWSETIKRMIRLHGVQLSPGDAKQLVRSLANSHGLALPEAARALYESERRVHWSEEQHDQDFRQACAQCHPLGRVLQQQRDEEEWQQLRNTHVAMFPLARGQMGGGPPPEEPRRFPGMGARRGGRPGQGGSGGAAPANEPPRAPTQSTGDRVLAKLAKDQPLFTPDWERYVVNRREVPLAGVWTLTGHDVQHGDLSGTVELVRTDADEYDTVWELRFADGTEQRRTGKGLLYAGYSWRGRCSDGGATPTTWREVLLLDAGWKTLQGRVFTGNYDEIGTDVTLHRRTGQPRVVAVLDGAVRVPTTGHTLVVLGESFPASVQPGDFFAGAGVSVTAAEFVDERQVRLRVDVATDAELGSRVVAYGSDPGSATIQLYDTVDYIRIRPLQGLSRVGGARHPKQLERFEAIAVHRGKDEKPYTDDDVDLFQVRPRWGLAEFAVRDQDDDLRYVGSIDPQSGVFTPAADGPNPERKWQANNVGDVFVTADVELEVPTRPTAKDQPLGPPVPRAFQARAHLLVTVPLYSRWNALEWEDR